MDRRQWLRWGGASLAGALGVGSLSALLQNPVKAQADGYKALVCLYMAGGSDSHNWLLPTDADNRASYATARGELAWDTIDALHRQVLEHVTAEGDAVMADWARLAPGGPPGVGGRGRGRRR